MSERVKVESLSVSSVHLRFRHAFAHHQGTRRESNPQIVRLQLSDGTAGYGEALPRPYVTGETEESVRRTLASDLAPRVLGWQVPDLAAAACWLNTADMLCARERAPAAFCAFEMALLDAVGRCSGRPVGDLLGPALRTELPCDGAVVGFVPAPVLTFLLGKIRRLGKRMIKVKVGRPEDAERLAAVRRVLGGEVEILLDANGAWSVGEAVEKISALECFGITAVEQPVPGRDLEGLAQVAQAVAVPIMADESICNLADALRLLELGGCGLWNLRVGKCGGLLGTLELARLAISQGIGVYLGSLVGESGLLGMAGRLVAAHLETFRHLEFDSSGNRLDDILREPLAPVVDNRIALPQPAPGLGVEVDPEKLRALSAAVVEPARTLQPQAA